MEFVVILINMLYLIRNWFLFFLDRELSVIYGITLFFEDDVFWLVVFLLFLDLLIFFLIFFFLNV